MLQRGTQRGNESLIFRKIQGYRCLTVRPWCLPAAPWVSDPRLSDWRALSSHTRQINQSQTASPLLFPGTRRVQRNSPRSACRSNSRPRSADLRRRADSKQVAEPPPSYDTRHQTFASPLLPVAERGYATHCTMVMSKRPESFIPWPLAQLARPVAFAPRQSSSLSREPPAGRAAYSSEHAFAQKVQPNEGLHRAHESRTV
jgi:hypothetical protein